MMIMDDSIKYIGEGVIARTLPKAKWTHQGHLLAALYWHRHRAYLVHDGKIGEIIRRYNEATGVINSDSSGYHETITLAYLRMTRWFLDQSAATQPLAEIAQALLQSRFAARDWPLIHWRAATLFSPSARLNWVEPDIQILPF